MPRIPSHLPPDILILFLVRVSPSLDASRQAVRGCIYSGDSWLLRLHFPLPCLVWRLACAPQISRRRSVTPSFRRSLPDLFICLIYRHYRNVNLVLACSARLRGIGSPRCAWQVPSPLCSHRSSIASLSTHQAWLQGPRIHIVPSQLFASSAHCCVIAIHTHICTSSPYAHLFVPLL